MNRAPIQLLGPDGLPLSRQEFKKAPPPKMGEGSAFWAGRNNQLLQLPGGSLIQFDLSRLQLGDYRAMLDHYQVSISLNVLAFMMHQLDWHVVCENQKIADSIEDNLRLVWTRLIRAVKQAYWAGFTPCALEYENDVDGQVIKLNKIKDLLPENCTVNWKLIDGWKPPHEGAVSPQVPIFDGIKQIGLTYPIPVSNSFWYPLLMENGDYYGRKLLRPAFQSWFFSMLIHLFANRYFERFGEPVPIGRADYDQELDIDGTQVSGRQAMLNILQDLRNRSVVVLPSDRIQVGTSGTTEYAFDIEYLESQMRGADFERYMQRLDEEISLSLFTPVLLMRTADVGSYNLGVAHEKMYLWMINALAGDLKEYIDRYIVKPLHDVNFSPNAPRATWEFRAMGKQNVEIIRTLVGEVFRGGTVGVKNIEQLGEYIGLDLKEVKLVTQPTVAPGAADPTKTPERDPRVGTDRQKPTGTQPGGKGQPHETVQKIVRRVRGQVENAYKKGTFGSEEFEVSMGYKRLFEDGLRGEGYLSASGMTDEFYDRMESWLQDVVPLGKEAFSDPDQFMRIFERAIGNEADKFVTT